MATILELSTEVNVDQIVIDRSLDRVVLEFDQPQGNHNGGTLLFGPHDGLLYLSTGDGGAAFDRGPGHNPKIGNSQDLSNLLGKVLRIDPLKNGQEDYSIPQDNPFVGQANTREEIFAFGLRNPFRMSFAELTPDTEAVILLGDVGQSTAEEINLVEAGGNYGWRVYEGANKTPSINDPKPQTPVIAPIAEYPQNIGRSVIGGQLYQGIIESLQNHYIFSDFFSSKTYVIKFEGSKATGFHSLDQVDNPGFVTSYLNDQSGEMWLSTFASGGALYRLEKKQ